MMSLCKLYLKPALLSLIILGLVHSASAVLFVADYIDNAGEGFFDSTYGTARRSAFEYALNTWSGLLSSSYEGETIRVETGFAPQNQESYLASTTVISGQSGFDLPYPSGQSGQIVFANALGSHLLGYDVMPAVCAMSITFGPAIDFYYGTDGNPGTQYSFLATSLHEIAHGLGLFTTLRETGEFDNSNLVSDDGIPSMWDTFVGNSSGTYLTEMTQEERAAAAVSDDLYWYGASGIEANGGDPVKLYAPTVWSASSVDHTDYRTDLMYPSATAETEAMTTPNALTLALLQDLGWNVVPEPSTVMIFIIGLSLIAGHLRRNRQCR